MASKPMRLTDEAERTALLYGRTVSEGIKEMKFQLDHTPKDKLQPATQPVYGVLTPEQKNELNPIFNERFWDKLEDIYKKYVPNSKPGFVRASEQVAKSNAPVKTFGKIDESEKLVEPTGRQGREVK